jgi:hypothetical protein
LVGANFSFAVRKSDRLAFVAEYAAHSGVFAEDIISSYHFGPRYYAKPRGRLQPFIEILAGGTHLNQSPSGSSPQDSTDRNGFSLLAGGGLDLRIKPWFAWRIVQTDYSFFHIAGDSSNGLRVDTGILFRFAH